VLGGKIFGDKVSMFIADFIQIDVDAGPVGIGHIPFGLAMAYQNDVNRFISSPT